MGRPNKDDRACALRCLRRRINCAGSALILFLFVGGLTTGWILRGFRDNGWRIGPPPMRWHPVTLLEVIDERILRVKLDGKSIEVIPVCRAQETGSDAPGQDIPLSKQTGDATAVMLDFGEGGEPEFDSQGRMLCRVWLHGRRIMTRSRTGAPGRY